MKKKNYKVKLKEKDKSLFFEGLDNDLMQKLFKQVQGFYTEDVQNPVGTRNLEKIREEKEKYLVPTLFQDETLKNKLSTWYKT